MSQQKNPDDPFQILTATRGLYCADERDRVYALLGLFRANCTYAGCSAVEPDYERPPQKVFVDFACLLVAQGYVHRLLSHVSHRPPWIPDWKYSPGYQPLRSRPLYRPSEVRVDSQTGTVFLGG